MASGRVPKTNIIVFIKIDDYFVSKPSIASPLSTLNFYNTAKNIFVEA